jgi:hypothetical protein
VNHFSYALPFLLKIIRKVLGNRDMLPRRRSGYGQLDIHEDEQELMDGGEDVELSTPALASVVEEQQSDEVVTLAAL